MRLVAAALSLGAQAGGEVARAVDRIAATLRERRELQAEVRALATQARASAAVLAWHPSPSRGSSPPSSRARSAFLVTSPSGCCASCRPGLEAVGAVWMARITRSAG